MAAQCFHHCFARDACGEGRQGSEDGTFRHRECGEVSQGLDEALLIGVRARYAWGRYGNGCP
jgi:hypothetical protein